MTRIRLEIDQVQIHRPKRRWKLYFVVAAEHPTDSDKMVVSVIPENTILVAPSQNNSIFFEGTGAGANGLYILSRPMPETRELNVHVYVMHSRRSVNDVGRILRDIESGMGGQAVGIVANILGTANPWLAIAKQALPLVGQILEKIPDRSMGFISMFERFGPEFENEVEIDREARGGNATIVYSWAVDN